MARDAHDERLWRSVKPVVSARKDDRGRIQGLGTAFVCGQAGATSYLLTCWHVLEAIGADYLRVMGRPATVVALGDKALDLALLAVEGLPETEILRLSDTGRADRPFRTIGHFWASEKEQDVVDSRPLDGRLGEERRKFSDRYGSVAGWEFSIAKDDAFDRIRAGYSGAPVFDPASGLVVAVISHQEGDILGHAVAVSNLPIIYPPADGFFDHSEGDEGGGRDPWIVKTLDHIEQAKPLRRSFRTAGCSAVAVVDGCPDDLPKYLADDVFLDPWPALDDIPQEATTLNPARYGQDESAFWSALHHCVPAPQQAVERDRQRDAVRAWLRERDRHLFCVSINIMNDGLHLPRLIRAARRFLADLARGEPGMRLLMLIVCLVPDDKPPWWWSLWRRCLKRNTAVSWLAPLRSLEKSDLYTWCESLSGDARRSLHCEQLREELLDLLQEGRTRVRYRLVRRRLVEGGTLDKVRIRR